MFPSLLPSIISCGYVLYINSYEDIALLKTFTQCLLVSRGHAVPQDGNTTVLETLVEGESVPPRTLPVTIILTTVWQYNLKGLIKRFIDLFSNAVWLRARIL